MHTTLIRFIAFAAMVLFSSSVFAAGFSKRYESIASFDGTRLGALVLVPEGQGAGPFPLVVMPSSWAVPNLEYVGRASVMASAGYIVVSYSSRGFWDSAGKIDIAGAPTVEDVSAVIDWALANTPADANAIGASGISYGAGTSLLAAARDPRIKAVAALSGWADLQASLYADRTVSKQGVALLVTAGALTGRPGPELTQITSKVAVGDYDGAVAGFLQAAAERSVVNEVQAINQNGTAVLLANSFNDGLFPPNQYIDFYNRLQVPKQLFFSQGDHATAELLGALGLPNAVYTAVTRWFDRYLKGQSNGVDNESPVQLSTLNGAWLHYADWNAVQGQATRYGLNRPAGLLSPTGALSADVSTGWSHRIATGVPTLADSGIVLVSGLLQGLGQPVTTSIPLVSRVGAAVWRGPVYTSTRRLVGSPSLRLTVTPSQANVSLFAYLYSVDALGIGQLLSHAPYSLRDATPGQATTIELALQATAVDIPAGRRLMLVVDTTDPRYTDATRFGGNVTFASPSATPSVLTVPLR